MNINPADLERISPWVNVMLRANLAASAGGPGILTIRVMIDEYGRPCPPWTSPKITHLEPRSQTERIMAYIDDLDDAARDRLLEALSTD